MEAPVFNLVKYFHPHGKLTLTFAKTNVEGILKFVEGSGFTLQEASAYAKPVTDDPVFGEALRFPSSAYPYTEGTDETIQA